MKNTDKTDGINSAESRKPEIAFIGGDLRALVAAGRLREKGYATRLYGFSRSTRFGESQNFNESGESTHFNGSDGSTRFNRSAGSTDAIVDSLCCSSCTAALNELLPYLDAGADVPELPLSETLDGASAVILPLPAVQDGARISMPLSGLELQAEALIDAMARHGVKLLCGGKLGADLCRRCGDAGIEVFDYYAREEFAVANAVPTAEGAVAIAMNELAITLDGSDALVIGYGRIGKLLSAKLAALGARVTVSARKPEDFAWINAAGFARAETGRLADYFTQNRPDVIFNTVPHCVLSRTELRRVTPGTLIVDLASKPGGVDIGAAGALGHKVIWALSLPGKVAPVTSGIIIADTILGHLKEVNIC